MIKATEKIWHNGKLIDWNDANIHVLAHVTSYGSSVFEGIRCYATESGPAIFRAREHARRLVDSAKIYRMDLPYGVDQLIEAMVQLVQVNNLESCYIRPLVLRGYGNVGCSADQGQPHRDVHRVLGVGQVSGAGSACRRAWTCACRVGPASRRTRCPRWPRPVRTT